jgi:2-polyprenyl-3-methyl-5-hydroxy-6-metoxy-1,4-benzoquinol methylase
MTEHYTLKLDRYSSHQQIASWLNRRKREWIPDRPGVVYDVGCAQGFLGQLLSSESFALYGMDLDLKAVTAARAFYRMVQQVDIEQPPFPEFPQLPDVLVLADVLEHTRHPEVCLRNLMETYLPFGGRVIVSVPNIANIFIRWSLLWGHFDYTDRGILDRTHLRFFSQRSISALFKSVGLDIDQFATTPIPLPLVNPAFDEGRPLWFLHRVNALAARLFPTLFGYQIILYGTYAPKS